MTPQKGIKISSCTFEGLVHLHSWIHVCFRCRLTVIAEGLLQDHWLLRTPDIKYSGFCSSFSSSVKGLPSFHERTPSRFGRARRGAVRIKAVALNLSRPGRATRRRDQKRALGTDKSSDLGFGAFDVFVSDALSVQDEIRSCMFGHDVNTLVCWRRVYGSCATLSGDLRRFHRAPLVPYVDQRLTLPSAQNNPSSS